METDKETLFYDLIRKDDLEGLKKAFLEDQNPCEVFPYEKSLIANAVVLGKAQILKFLIAQGCDMNKGDTKRGVTPLQAAVLTNNIEMVRILLDAKAKIDTEDSNGNTPLMEAVFEFQGDLSIARVLFEHGANPMHYNKSNISPNGLAETTSKQELIQLFKPQ